MKCCSTGFLLVTLTIAHLPLAYPAAPTGPKPRDPVDAMAAALEPSAIIPYKEIGGRKLHLHVFYPPGKNRSPRSAAFVTIHGGGWTGGNARRMYPFAAHFAQRGMVGISVEYRLLDANAGVTVFDCVDDARAALRYVRGHAAELSVDPTRIVASGGSAGGHLAAATAFAENVNDQSAAEALSCRPDALVLYFPVIDTSAEGYGNAKIGAAWRQLSPLHQVRPGMPPTIVFHGTGDTVTPFAGAKAFHEAMLAAGNNSQLVVHPEGVHGYLMRDRKLFDESLRATETFLASLGLLGPVRQ